MASVIKAAADRLKGLSEQILPNSDQYNHPLDPLSVEEINIASAVVRKAHEGGRLQFRYVTMIEPPKQDLIVYVEAERRGEKPAPLPRIAEAQYSEFTGQTGWAYTVYETYVNIDTKEVISKAPLPDGVVEALSFKSMADATEILLKSDLYKAAIEKLKLPKGTMVEIDPWMYGVDSTDPSPNQMSFLCYARHPSNNNVDGNHYAVPLPIIPVIDVHSMTVTKILPAASGGIEDGLAYNTHPENVIDHCIANEYLPELQPGGLRKDLKPLQVVQPEGASFTVKGRLVEWQKWRFRVGWNYREGVVVHDVSYDGRSVFHRLSLSDMTVPYADPRSPYHRKQAFDLGDIGAGLSANNLALGCDCLGVIHYFAGALSTHTGEGERKDNVVCLHEQDMGIGWKHTNFRTERAVVTRNRMLVLQQIITVANYEYIFAWQFDQAGAIHFETRATGILSTCPIDPGKTSKWGTVVSPGVLAQFHQHIFAMRIDPAIDGWTNSVVQEDVVPVPVSAEENPYGNAFVVKKQIIEKSGYADAAPQLNRAFKIINPSKKNPYSGNPVGYKLVPHPGQLLLADPNSINAKRARFAQHHIWVTKHRDGDLWCGGKYTNQSFRETGGVQDMVDRNEDVVNTDIVLWHSFGLTHIPRVEDFPVMPVEVHLVTLKPADFFTGNPAIDIPQSAQASNKSILFGGVGSTAPDAGPGPASTATAACCEK